MELKSKREAAELLGVSTRGVERAVRRGHLTVLYRDSKHGKTAWFRPHELERYKEFQEESRDSVGFTSGIPERPLPGSPPVVGTLVPMVEIPWRESGRKRGGNPVPVADRLTLSVDEAAHLSGLPRNFIVKNIHSGKLKAVKIGRSYHVKRSELDRFVQELES